ncbi:MAG TPA: hypothetical protein VFY65_05930 [Longimicrobium sp.]|nr:hypothetical protein [Longimicrobium sp.]
MAGSRVAGGCIVLFCALSAACGGDWPGADSPAPEGGAVIDSSSTGTPGAERLVEAPVDSAAADPPIAGQPSSDVAGRWQGTADQVEFFAGGRVLLRRAEFRGVGRYEFVEPGRLLITWEGALVNSTPGDYAVSRADSLLSLCETDRPARCIRYARHRAGDAIPSLAGDPTAPRLAEPARGAASPAESRMAEAGPMLKQAATLQQVYQMEHGRYASTMDALRVVGWQEAPLRHFRQPRVVRADERRLCIVAEPLSADLWPVHIDEQGDLNRGPC